MSFGKPKDDSDDKKNLGAGLRASTAFGSSVAGGSIAGNSTTSDAVLGRGSKVVGALTFTGSVEIDCEVEGEIHSKERLTIGEGAHVKAKIHGTDIIIRGTVIGDVVATKS